MSTLHLRPQHFEAVSFETPVTYHYSSLATNHPINNYSCGVIGWFSRLLLSRSLFSLFSFSHQNPAAALQRSALARGTKYLPIRWTTLKRRRNAAATRWRAWFWAWYEALRAELWENRVLNLVEIWIIEQTRTIVMYELHSLIKYHSITNCPKSHRNSATTNSKPTSILTYSSLTPESPAHVFPIYDSHTLNQTIK
jgi:hypothetical protein